MKDNIAWQNKENNNREERRTATESDNEVKVRKLLALTSEYYGQSTAGTKHSQSIILIVQSFVYFAQSSTLRIKATCYFEISGFVSTDYVTSYTEKYKISTLEIF
jgi:hypothetical protein